MNIFLENLTIFNIVIAVIIIAVVWIIFYLSKRLQNEKQARIEIACKLITYNKDHVKGCLAKTDEDKKIIDEIAKALEEVAKTKSCQYKISDQRLLKIDKDSFTIENHYETDIMGKKRLFTTLISVNVDDNIYTEIPAIFHAYKKNF